MRNSVSGMIKVLAFSFLIAGCITCSGGKDAGRETLVSFDVNKKYAEKDIYIQDIADIEYLLLESSDDYLLCYDDKASNSDSFFLLSKKDGHVIDIPIYFTEKISMMVVFMRSDGVAIATMLDRCFVSKNGADYSMS